MLVPAVFTSNLKMASSSSKRLREYNSMQEDDPTIEDDIPMKDLIPGDERTPLQVLMDEAQKLLGNEHERRTEFMVAIYDLIHARDTFMVAMKGVFEPYPHLLKPLNDFMPGYMINGTWKDFKPIRETPVDQIEHPVRGLIHKAELFGNDVFITEIIENLSNLISSRIDGDTFMANMKTKNIASNSPVLDFLNKLIPGYIHDSTTTERGPDGYIRKQLKYYWIK